VRKTFFIAGFLLLPFAAQAALPSKPVSSEADRLFAQLAKADSPEAAHPLEEKLNALFRQSGSASADLLMARAQTALGAADQKTAMKILAAVTRIAPAYAEAWHVRANLEAAGGHDGEALVALQKTVLLNPRHFAALAELAAMLADYGDKSGALKLYRRALALDPQLPGVARQVQALGKAVEGQDI
jgi:tetratricopeptide (TPR) repeat protein